LTRAKSVSRARRLTALLGTMLLTLAAIVLLFGLGAGRAQAQFALGLQGDGFADGSGPQAAKAYGAMRAINGSYVRIALEWSEVVGNAGQSTPPKGFNYMDPNNPNYTWGQIDAEVRSVVAHRLQPIFVIDRAPNWAIGPGTPTKYTSPGSWNPNPTLYSGFIHAAATRYSGTYPDPQNRGKALPRVKYWEPWNEPNIPGYLNAPNPIAAYRNLLAIAYRQLKAVHSDNKVMLGGLAPVSPVPGSTPPLTFAADLMCLRPVGSGYKPVGSCQRARFDILAVHPYSLTATPTAHATKPGDMFTGDMGKVRALLRAAGNRYPLWATEFSWFTNPPDPQVGDPPNTAARYVAYSLYEMWKAATSVVIWFQVIDSNSQDSFSGGGLYYASGRPKPTLQAFAFPFVAGVNGGRGWAWGRVPSSGARSVVVERRTGARWIKVASARTGSDGVFTAAFSARGNAVYRARVSGGPTSLPYNSTPIPARRTHLNTAP
jgi:hypothetical protein